MDAPPERESVRLFCETAAALAGAGVNVPTVFHSDDARGFALMTDFGDTTYLRAVGDGADADRLYSPALRALAAIQGLGGAGRAGLPPYSRRLLADEMALYPDWYIRRHIGREPTAREDRVLADAFGAITDRTHAQPAVPVHRDYHSRNLMVTTPCPGILDFQDAVVGPVTYDLLSLLGDAYVRWPEPRTERWTAEYLALARERGLPVPTSDEAFREDLDWMGVQRFLKVAGIFCRLFHRDGKPSYLGDLPLVEDRLVETTARLPGMGALHRVVSDLREERAAQ